MTINAKDKSFTISLDELQRAEFRIIMAIRKARDNANLPMEGFSGSDPKLDYDRIAVEYSVLEAAKAIGLTIGNNEPGQLDVREK